MRQHVTVVEVRSLSYTGTTYSNLLLGCHERAFTVGPPRRVIEMLEDPGQDGSAACLVHGTKCGFWPRFFKTYDRGGNLFVQLAEATGRDVFVINNAFGGPHVDRHLDHPEIDHRVLRVVRDGRAVVSSYMKYFEGKDVWDAVTGWFARSARRFAYDPANPDELSMRYEDIAEDPIGFLNRAGEYLGLTYDQKSYRYWEYEHHMTTGNGGPLNMIRRFSGERFVGPDAEYQEERYQKLLEQPARSLIDERWKKVFSRRDRLVFDFFVGDINQQWGYERDEFGLAEIVSFITDFEASGLSLEEIDPLPAFRSDMREVVSRLISGGTPVHA